MAKCLLWAFAASFVIFSVFGSPLEKYETIMGVRVYDLDPVCAMVGGVCVKSNDCVEQTTKTGLCPTNHHIGVECCYELAVKQGACRSFGGECVTYNCGIVKAQANDCAKGEQCCVLI